MVDLGSAIPAVLETTVESMGDGLAVVDAAGKLVVYNSAAEDLLGRGSFGIPPSDWPRHYGFYLPDRVTLYPADQLPLARARRGETVDGAEIFVRNPRFPEGRWLSSTARPLRDLAGAIVGAVVVIRDFSERKRNEEAVIGSEQFYRLLFEKNVAGILHTSVEGEILACNDAFARMLGFAGKEDAIGHPMGELYFDPPERDAMMRELRKTGQLVDYELCFRRCDGSRAWAIADINYLEPSPGKTGGSLLGTMIEISDRKIWEEALTRSEQRFSSFMRHLPGVAFIKDLEGRYAYLNEASGPLLNFDPRSTIGKLAEEIWPAEIAASHRVNDLSVLRTGQPAEFVEDIPLTDGVHSWLMCKFPMFDERGEIGLLGGIGIDITERRRIEEQLQQSSKMEAVGRLAGGVAHDFNNLLTVISGYGQMLLDAIERGRAIDREYVEALLEASKRAAALTNQLLAFSRRQVIQPRVIDLNWLVINMEKMLRRVIPEHVELNVEPYREPCMILADAGQFEQVVMNLTANARDAMPKRGTLTIRTGVVKRMSGERVLLEISDTGNGMDAATRAHVFEPFFTSKEKGKGTGLGLSTVYGIVKQSGGDISVDSELGRGTTFAITLPRVEGHDEGVDREAGAKPARRGTETVLLVEDEPSVRQLVREMLSQQGYRVIEAGEGREALSLYERHRDRIDLVLTDVIMPRMSGRELAERIGAMDAQLKVVYMSGYTDDIIAQHGVMAEDTAFLQKPFTPAALARKLREVLDARR